METITSCEGIDDQQRQLIEGSLDSLCATHLDAHLAPFAHSYQQLRVRVTKDAHRTGGAYRVKLRLCLPCATLTAEDEAEDLLECLYITFASLEQRIERCTRTLRKMDEWRHRIRRDNLRHLKAAVATGTVEQSTRFFEESSCLLPGLQRFVRRELAYLQARDDLAKDYPNLVDVIDEVLAHVYIATRDDGHSIASADLEREALKVLQTEVVARRKHEGRAGLDGQSAVTLTQRIYNLDDDIFEFWQPDEALRLIDSERTAEDPDASELGVSEARVITTSLFMKLPNSWRRAALLAEVDGMQITEIGARLDADEATVRRWIEHADAFVRDSLCELGIKPVTIRLDSRSTSDLARHLPLRKGCR